MPAEDVSLFAVDLPVARRARRVAAGFAVEDHLATPLEETHVALGPRLTGTHYLVAAMDPEKMPDEAGQVVVPEQMILPAPIADRLTWRVRRTGERALVRASDGAGFAATLDQLPTLWAAFGRPPVESVGEALPKSLNATARPIEIGAPVKRDLTFDLRQGRFSPAPNQLRNAALAGAIMVATAGAVNGALLYRDVVQLEAALSTERDQVAPGLARFAPGLTVSPPTLAALDRALAERGRPKDDVFLGLMGNLSAGLLAEGHQATLASVDYAQRGGALSVRIQGASTDALRRVATGLEAAGFAVETGAITAGAAGAETVFTLRETRDGT